MASDPEAFERMALGKDKEVPVKTTMEVATNQTASTPRYQRVEDWDREQKAKAAETSWEERVQYEGQRFGDGFRQNEILRHHLNSF